MSSRDRDAGRKFESAENIPSTSSWVPPPSSSKNSEDDDELITSLSFRSSVPPSTLSSQEHESEPEPTFTSMTAGMENLNPQNDPGLWPITITDVDRTEIVLRGPIRIKVELFPVNDNGRRFSEYHYNKILVNGEKLDRRWMIYSQTKDAVYCFPCRIFGLENTKIGSSEGVCDWKHLGDYLKSHESSRQHKDCMLKWIHLENGLKSCSTIDSLAQSQIEQEWQRWRSILERLLAIVNFLASHNLAFRGHRKKLTSDSGSSETSGNFIDLVKLIARFDPVLRLHLKQEMQHRLVSKQNLFLVCYKVVQSVCRLKSEVGYFKILIATLSETRWECRVSSVKAVKYQLSDICDALKDLAESTTDCQLVSECHSEITTYEFVISLVIWYDILIKINVISKMWQSENMHLDVAIQHLDAFTNWLDNYRENGFQSSLVTAREIAEENDIDRHFKEVRRRRKKRLFDYEGEDEIHELNAEEIATCKYL
ncbi:Zinc finger MYM-type protein 5 [Eumeta japonica]|uniref:Zinc finger MYM-type protein 5 n=1 Tax=Eumeta variegata TaxID=151549 RepID=A0A4C1VF80_EUMVA|nr:Zinc finger MYM-type protein 5 [Eumeta japonica]